MWYRATEADLTAYAGGVLEKVPLGQILRFADTWALLPSTLGQFATLTLLFFAHWSIALGAGVLVYVIGRLLLPGVVLFSLSTVIRVVVHPAFQVLVSFFALSYLGTRGNLVAGAVGLAAFVLYRWDIPGIVLGGALKPLLDRLYPLPAADQILRATLIRLALRHGVELSQISAMESQLRSALNRKRK